jgi:hypothetical protein
MDNMKTLTSFILGTVMLIGPAMAAQTSTAVKPAPAAHSTAKKAAVKKPAVKKTAVKKVAHSKKAHSKATRTVAKKSAVPVTPVAAKK